MKEKMEIIFEEICEGMGKAWYEVYDSNLFEEVKRIIATQLFEGNLQKLENNKDFQEWDKTMAWDL